MTTPEMKDVTCDDALRDLHEWINNLDHDQLAGLYSQHCEDCDVAVRVLPDTVCGGTCDYADASNYYMAGKCMRVQLVPVEEPFSLPR
jgi:hypothetical protein